MLFSFSPMAASFALPSMARIPSCSSRIWSSTRWSAWAWSTMRRESISLWAPMVAVNALMASGYRLVAMYVWPRP